MAEPNTPAEWDVSLMVECPKCGWYFDLLNGPETLEGIEICEQDTPQTQDVACVCPACWEEFLADYSY